MKTLSTTNIQYFPEKQGKSWPLELWGILFFFFTEIKQNKWGGEKSRESLYAKRESEL